MRLYSFCILVCGTFSIGASAAVADCLLVRFVQSLWDTGVSRSVGVHAVLSVQHKHGWRNRLVLAWKALQRWKDLARGKTRLPIPMGVLQLQFLCGLTLAAESCPLDSVLWVSSAVLWLVGFFGLLRPKEVRQMLVGDMVFPAAWCDDGAGPFAV